MCEIVDKDNFLLKNYFFFGHYVFKNITDNKIDMSFYELLRPFKVSTAFDFFIFSYFYKKNQTPFGELHASNRETQLHLSFNCTQSSDTLP